MSKKEIKCGYNVVTNRCSKNEKGLGKFCKVNRKTKKCQLKEKPVPSDILLSMKNKNVIKKVEPTYFRDVEETLPSNFDQYKKDIVNITNRCWSKKQIKKRASFNSKDTTDLFTKKLDNDKIFIIDSEKDQTAKFNVNYEDKRAFMDVATNFNTRFFWRTKFSRLQFIYFVLKTYSLMFEEIYKKTVTVNKKKFKITENNLNIMFKGGNTFRIVIKELIRNFEAKTEKYITSLIEKYIKIGDFDFEVISYNLPHHIVNKINNISYVVILRLRNYLTENNFFDFFNYNDETGQKKLAILKENLIETSKSLDKDAWYNNIKIDYINIGNIIHGKDNKTLEQINKQYIYRDDDDYILEKSIHGESKKFTKRLDFVIIQDGQSKTKRNDMDGKYRVGLMKAQDFLKTLELNSSEVNLTGQSRKNGYFLYCTHNSIVNIHNDVGHEFNISFQLNRIKYNYVIYYRKKVNGKLYYFKDDIPGEILDLNHTYASDRKKYKFKQAFNKNKYLDIYTFPKFKVSFYSYSLIGMLDDVEVIIFDEVDYKPWNETKYKKRIYRVLTLVFLMFFNKIDGLHYKSKLMIMQKMISNIKENKFNLTIKDKELNRIQTKLKKVYNKRKDNPKNLMNIR